MPVLLFLLSLDLAVAYLEICTIKLSFPQSRPCYCGSQCHIVKQLLVLTNPTGGRRESLNIYIKPQPASCWSHVDPPLRMELFHKECTKNRSQSLQIERAATSIGRLNFTLARPYWPYRWRVDIRERTRCQRVLPQQALESGAGPQYPILHMRSTSPASNGV